MQMSVSKMAGDEGSSENRQLKSTWTNDCRRTYIDCLVLRYRRLEAAV